ncbi:MAG: element excision factor XisH family protein [Saprospiraceae bacterium]
MPRKDKDHNIVREALEKDGWNITHDPYRLEMGNVELVADLGAEKLMAAERGLEKILVEIKTFGRMSVISAFHEAVGQFRNYRRLLRKTDAERALFLAISEETFNFFMSEEFYRMAIEEDEISVIVYSKSSTTVVKWEK